MKGVILVLIVVFFKITLAREDLLENIRVSKANEPELNDFLRSVLRHKEDFRWIRNAVDRIRLEQLTRNLKSVSTADEVNEDFSPAHGSYDMSGQMNNVENVQFQRKSNRRRGLPHQYSKYRRPINDVYPYNQFNEPRYKRSFEYYKDDNDRSFNDDSDNSNVKILTRSDAGVRNMPGVKIQRNHRSECISNHESHEYIPPKDDDADSNKKDNTSIMGEYYYSTPHDLLGISQDLKCENARILNETCVKSKKSAKRYHENHLRRRDSNSKDDRSIKVNIVDKGKLIKTVEQSENSNSLVLTFKGESEEEKAASKDLASGISAPPAPPGLLNLNNSFNSGSSSIANISFSNYTENFINDTRPLTAFRRLEISNVTDDTLDNIDKILRHDQESLKNSSYLPAYLKVKKDILGEEEIELLPSKMHSKEARMVKQEQFIPEGKLMVERNHPRFNDERVDGSKNRQKEDYDIGYVEEPYNNPERSPSDANEENYEYRSIINNAKQNIQDPMIQEKVSKDQPYNDHFSEKAFKGRRAHKNRNTDSDMEDSLLSHDKASIHNHHRGRSNPNSETKILPNGIEETITQDPPGNKKNLLEDETEPTSAAEQRELEKKDYSKFGSPSMDSLTTEKMLVIPLKKTYRGKPSDTEESDSKYSKMEEYDDYNANLIDLGDKPEADDKKFHVKDSKDMIHIKMQKSNQDDDEEAVNNEQLKRSDLDVAPRLISHNKLANIHNSERTRKSNSIDNENLIADTSNSEKIRNAMTSEDDDVINRRGVIEKSSGENEYGRSIGGEYAQNSDQNVNFHGRHILSIPESQDILTPFDANLDYQNGISNAVNIRVKRTESFDDVDEEETAYDEEDIGEYSNLGPKLHYEKKHIIKPKDVIPVDKLAMGAEETLGLGDVPTCVSKRLDQDVEEIKAENSYPAHIKRVGSSKETSKLTTEMNNKDSDSHIDGNVQINNSPKDKLPTTKIVTKEDNEVHNYTKPARNANHTVNLKLNDDDSEDHENDVKKYRKVHKDKQNHIHKHFPHSLLDVNENIRNQLMQIGNKQHSKHDRKFKLKNRKFKGSQNSRFDSGNTKNPVALDSAITLNKDIQNSAVRANEIGQREMRQNLEDDDSTTAANACNENKEDNRNELQIIEKDQAIIFKFTTPNTDINKGSSKCDSNIESNDSEDSGDSETNKEYCDSGHEIDNPDPNIGEGEEESKPAEPTQVNNCGPGALSLIRNVNGTFGSESLDKAFAQKAKPLDLSDDADLFDKISGLMAKYGNPQNGRHAGDEMFASIPLFIQNRSLSFDDDDIVSVNHHVHKDKNVHPPKNKQLICTKAPKHEDSDDDADSFSKDEYDTDSIDKDVDKNTVPKSSNPSHSLQLLKSSNKNASFHDLDSVESFSDIVEKQNKAKRTKKHVIDYDILPSNFEKLTQVEEEVDSGKPSVRKKRYLKFLFKNSSNLAKAKSRRDIDSDYLEDNFLQRGKRRLNDYDMYRNYADYDATDYNNYEPKYSRASVDDNKSKQQNMYLIPNMQIMPNNMRYIQSNQNLQSIQNMRNRYDTARRYNLIKNYRNITSSTDEFNANNNTNTSSHIEEINSRSTTSEPLLNHSSPTQKNISKTNTTKKYGKKNENLKEIMNGQLIMNIIDKFTQKLKTNEMVYKRFGKRIPRKRAELVVEKLSAYRDQQAKKDIKHAEIMLHQVIIMLNRVVMDQVHRKICMTISPDLRSYLAMITLNTCKGGKMSNQIAEGYPLPELHGGNGTIPANQPPPPDDDQGDFLFEGDIGGKGSKYNSSNDNVDSSETAGKKIHLIKKLLNKYNNMSASCQVKVEPVKDYLIEHMEMLQKIKNKELSQSFETTTELDDSCDNENVKPPQLHGLKQAGGNADVLKESHSTTLRSDINAIRSSTLSRHSSSAASSQSEAEQPASSDSPSASSMRIDDSSIKVEARGATPYYQLNANYSQEDSEEDAQEMEAAKQKFIKTYGRSRIYPLVGRYSDPIAHFQSELARENVYKEPYIKESNPFNVNLDSRPNYLSALDANPPLDNNRIIVSRMDDAPYKQRGHYVQEPEHNSMMLDALQNPIPIVGNLQARKQRRSANSTFWHGSDKYQKLVEAATELRRKRDIEERIGKLFGRRNAKYKKSYEYKPANDNDVYPDLSKVQFETPLIYRVV